MRSTHLRDVGKRKTNGALRGGRWRSLRRYDVSIRTSDRESNWQNRPGASVVVDAMLYTLLATPSLFFTALEIISPLAHAEELNSLGRGRLIDGHFDITPSGKFQLRKTIYCHLMPRYFGLYARAMIILSWIEYFITRK